MQKSTIEPTGGPPVSERVLLPILVALSVAHLLNDMIQSLVPAAYPILKEAYALSFAEVGLITLTFQLTASLLQPLVGMYTDSRPQPYSLVAGMGLTLAGLLVLAWAGSYPILLLGAGLIGTGSSIFHPESTRMARFASGGRLGFAQSLFQVGGHAGAALGPLLAAFVIVPRGQASLSWFSIAALLAMGVLFVVGRWYGLRHPPRPKPGPGAPSLPTKSPLRAAAGAPARPVVLAIVILVILMFSKSAYSASLSSYYTFYLIDRFGLAVGTSQILLFVYLAASAVGSLIGGHLGDRFGRRRIIWFSIVGAVPFTLALPYVSLLWTAVFTIIIGMIMASAFPAILVYAMELLPGRVGMIAGLFYGLSFGLGGLSAALLGTMADFTSIETVYALCAYLPLIGLLTWFLPEIVTKRAA